MCALCVSQCVHVVCAAISFLPLCLPLSLSLFCLRSLSDLSLISLSLTSTSFCRSHTLILSLFLSLALYLSPGLPAGVLISFVWVVAGLTIGWLAIGIHQYNLTNAAVKAVQVGWRGMW